MPSKSLLRWRSDRAIALDEIAQAHASVGGTLRGRRYTTRQINYAFASLLSSNFQGFCRDLHSECVDHIVVGAPVAYQALLRVELVLNRKLDHGNPNPGNIGSDFNRLGVSFWSEVAADGPRNPVRKQALQKLNDWRNAIAHQDFSPLGGTASLHLATVKRWRGAVDGLADCFDRVMQSHIDTLLGQKPW